MPAIICSYCQYVGSGHSPEDMFRDTEIHEQTCKKNPDYTEPVEDEYELCEIFKYGDGLRYTHVASNLPLWQAPGHKDYAGYLYEDGNIYSSSVMYSIREQANLGYFTSDFNLKAERSKVLRPTHVVFKKA